MMSSTVVWACFQEGPPWNEVAELSTRSVYDIPPPQTANVYKFTCYLRSFVMVWDLKFQSMKKSESSGQLITRIAMGGYHTHRELIVEQCASQTYFCKLREGSGDLSIQAVSLHGCTIDPRKSRKNLFTRSSGPQKRYFILLMFWLYEKLRIN